MPPKRVTSRRCRSPLDPACRIWHTGTTDMMPERNRQEDMNENSGLSGPCLPPACDAHPRRPGTGRPQELLVLVDNAAASENVSRFLRRSGFEVSVNQPENALWEVHGLSSATQVEAPEQAPAAAPAADTESRKTLVLITTDTLGRGDDELGARLMENFLASLPELGASLWRIVLLNGGVKLAATEGKCLDTLKQLESNGVSILVCGTCLNFFNLLEAKQVGETTNMMDVVTSLSLADKVIRP